MDFRVTMDEVDYELPQTQIATAPPAQRGASKLLVYQNGAMADDTFSHLPYLLPENCLLVLNNSRVIKARLLFKKATGGAIEIFCLEPALPAAMETALQQTQMAQWRCLVGGASKWLLGTALQKDLVVNGTEITLSATYLQREPEGFVIGFGWTGGARFADVLQAAGSIPLPPYLKRAATPDDTERYQTVFASQSGSVAAPTAALHFTDELLAHLGAAGVRTAQLTLHVGAGTFKPVKAQTIAAHQMHAEWFTVGMRFLKSLIAAPSIVAVGTTSLRTLESLYWLGVKACRHGHLKNLNQWEAYELNDGGMSFGESIAHLVLHLEQSGQTSLSARTALLIIPGYKFRSAVALVTNFHQPRSTLLLLVAAFVGDDWKRVYQHALAGNYLFLSYGDSSLLFRQHQP